MVYFDVSKDGLKELFVYNCDDLCFKFVYWLVF